MLEEQAAALAAVEQRAAPVETGVQPQPSQAEGDQATIEQSLREKEA
jgi:hypothetical protein